MFIFILLCGASKGFMKAFKSFIRLFEAPQSSAEIKTEVNYFCLSGIGTGRVNLTEKIFHNSSVIRQKGESQNGCFVWVSGGKKCSLFGKFGVRCFFFWNTRFEIRIFTLLTTNWYSSMKTYYWQQNIFLNWETNKF